METGSPKSFGVLKPGPSINPWLLILLTAPLPVMLFVFFFYKWYSQKTDLNQMTRQFVQRQNTVLAYDALSVSQEMTSLLEGAARDVQTLALLAATPENFLKFYEAHTSQIARIDAKQKTVHRQNLPIYFEVASLNSNGMEMLRLVNGKVEKRNRTLSQCTESTLCDYRLVRKMVEGPVGTFDIGTLMKWYVPQGGTSDDSGATLRVAYKTAKGISVLGIDYRYIKNVLYSPIFPYQNKSNLLEGYENGNYVFIIDDENNIIAHPKFWHVIGVDRKTGKWVTPMQVDEDSGKHPINISAYRGEKLKRYFDRLLTQTFPQKGVDIFRAPNLTGAIRVLSVAPVLFSFGRFKQNGVYGHVIVGCLVDYFEEPKEKIFPYY